MLFTEIMNFLEFVIGWGLVVLVPPIFTGLLVQIIAQSIILDGIQRLRKELDEKGFSRAQITEISKSVWNNFGRCRIFHIFRFDI